MSQPLSLSDVDKLGRKFLTSATDSLRNYGSVTDYFSIINLVSEFLPYRIHKIISNPKLT